MVAMRRRKRDTYIFAYFRSAAIKSKFSAPKNLFLQEREKNSEPHNQFTLTLIFKVIHLQAFHIRIKGININANIMQCRFYVYVCKMEKRVLIIMMCKLQH